MTYLSEVLADAPLFCWVLDDTSTTAADATGNGRTGTYQNGIIPGRALPLLGEVARAPVFAGAAGSLSGVSIPDDPAWDVSDLTTEAIICAPPSLTTGHVMDRDTGSGTRSFQFGLSTTGGPFFTRVSGGSVAPTGLDLRDKQRHHLVATLGGGTCTLYVDGTAVGSGAMAAMPTGTNRIDVGFRQGTTSSQFLGVISHAAYYPTALSAARIAAHAAAMGAIPTGYSPGGGGGPVASWSTLA